MRYLKLYEESGNPDFEPVSLHSWNDFIANIVSFNPVRVNALSSELKKEIKKTVPMGAARRRKVTDSPSITSDILNYLVIYIDKNMIFVYELEDEYYGVYADIGKLYFRFKCDQIEGVSKCIEHIISTPQPEPKPTQVIHHRHR